ncbi:MAG: hypothetical protein RLN90_14905 [Balneolaceae bacterium]
MMCKLCNAFNDPGLSDQIENTVLLKTPNFKVIPALGPIEVGHVLIVSNNHFDNLLNMRTEQVIEYQKVTEYLKSLCKGIELVEAEHGSNLNNKSATCIIHTHINLIPLKVDCFSEFDRLLNVRYDKGDISNYSGEKSYIYLNSKSNFRLYDSFNLPSQFIRRVLADILNFEAWDWRENPNYKTIEKTIDFWQERNI